MYILLAYARSDKKDHRPTELCLSTIDEIKRQARNNGFNSFNWSLSWWRTYLSSWVFKYFTTFENSMIISIVKDKEST